MRNKIGNEIWGVIFILIGLVVGLNAFNLIDFSLFFTGWWTLFIIVPCLIAMIQDGIRVSNTIGLTIGLLLFLAERDILSWGIISNLIWPIVLVWIGLGILFRDRLVEVNSKKIREINKDGAVKYSALFAGQEISFPNEVFKGAVLSAVFGGVELNLKNAIIENDTVIDATAIFGGVDIIVPANVNVKVSCTPIFGGVDNKAVSTQGENVHTIFVNGVCTFGGIEIK